MTRRKLYWTTIGLAISAALIGILLAAGSLGCTAMATLDGSSTTMDIIDFLATGYNFLPALLFFTGLATLTLGWAPKLGKVIYLAYSFLLNYFGGILDLPEWISKTAIQSWIPQIPLDNFNAPTFFTITGISIVLMINSYN